MLGVSYFNQPISFCSSSNVEFSWPTNMEMADFSERRNSLNSISSQTRHSLADIADAGFYYDTNKLVLNSTWTERCDTMPKERATVKPVNKGQLVFIDRCPLFGDVCKHRFDWVALICYYCGEHVDIHYLNQRPDPWRAHLSASSKCFHNILMRGDDFMLSGEIMNKAHHAKPMLRKRRRQLLEKC